MTTSDSSHSAIQLTSSSPTEAGEALQVGSIAKVYTMVQALRHRIGNYIITPLAASRPNRIPYRSADYSLTLTPGFDIDYGVNVSTTRCAFAYAAVQPVVRRIPI